MENRDDTHTHTDAGASENQAEWARHAADGRDNHGAEGQPHARVLRVPGAQPLDLGRREPLTIKDFYGAGVEDTSRQGTFEFTNGEPPVLLGQNEGANPVEFLLHALAGCVTTTTVLHAAARGIEIESLSTRLVGDIDLQGLLALADVPAGYGGIRIEMDIKAKNASDADLDALIGFAQAHSPVCNAVCRPVPVVVERVSL